MWRLKWVLIALESVGRVLCICLFLGEKSLISINFSKGSFDQNIYRSLINFLQGIYGIGMADWGNAHSLRASNQLSPSWGNPDLWDFLDKEAIREVPPKSESTPRKCFFLQSPVSFQSQPKLHFASTPPQPTVTPAKLFISLWKIGWCH